MYSKEEGLMVKTFNEMYIDFTKKVQDDNKTLLHFNDRKVNFREFTTRVEEIMRQLLRLGVREGTGIGYTLDNCIDILPLFIAASRLGAYTFPLFAGFPPSYKVTSYQRAFVSIIITNEKYAAGLKEAAKEIGYDVTIAVVDEHTEFESIYGDSKEGFDINDFIINPAREDLPLLIGLSSGTTGIPKMVAMSQRNIGSEVIVMMDMDRHSQGILGLVGKEDKRMVAFPFSTSVMLVVLGMMILGEVICY
ncbi:MAG TPA: hypothetical protein DCW90_07090, partial [Lachnospiraceae bacterium]|nr:hypothetical protein [Lachnospiraceae bacterium]